MKLILKIIIFFIFSFTLSHLYFSKPDMAVISKTLIFRIDSSFSKKEINIILDAIDEWQSYLEGLINISGYVDNVGFLELYEWNNDGRPTIYDASHLFNWRRQMVYIGSSTLGITALLPKDIFIAEKDFNFKAIVLHELAHAISGKGEHSINKNDLMFPKINNNLNITINDINYVKKAISK